MESKFAVSPEEVDRIMPFGAELWPDEADLTPLLRFTGKEEYLAWVAGWKEAYALLSAQIREVRTWEKEYQRNPKQAGDNNLPSRLRLKARARGMLALRHLGKKESWKQKLAGAAVVSAA